MSVLLPKLGVVDEIARILGRKTPHAVETAGPWGSGKSLIAVQAAQALGRSLLVVTAGRIEAEAVFDDVCTFAGEAAAAYFPAWEVLPTDSMAPSDDIVAERMNTLKRLAAAQARGETMHVVLPVRSLVQRVVPPRRLSRDTISLQVGQEYSMEDLLDRLLRMGYVREAMVEQRGEMSVRGGIFDVFPISSELPVRIEFFGDEIDSIRRFEPETQRSVERLESTQIPPRSEKAMLAAITFSGEGLSAITAHLPKDAVVVLDEPAAVTEAARALDDQIGDNPYYMPWQEAEQLLAKFPRLYLSQVGVQRRPEAARVDAPMRSMANWAGQVADFWEQLKQWDLAGYAVRIFCVNTGERRRLMELIEEQGYRPGRDAFDLRVELGRLRAGFSAPNDKLAVLSERELFGRHYMRRARRRFEAGAALVHFSDLKSGDYIVHAVHGIGRYVGLRRFEGKAGDFMALQYAGGDTLYVPVTHIDQVQKFIGGDGAMPKVDRLGGATWARTRARVKKAVRDMAADLIALYADRESRPGHAFGGDTPWQQEFDDAFEYEETPDQDRAIREVKIDMETPRPMDRLICGDVGYGKTEVAMRAAFKAVMDGKQVAVLAPTTVLVQQHYSTFRERFADFPVRIEVLSRFRTPKQQQESIDAMKAGEADIIIGTHRLLSKDIGFKDLGLLIIDEEQRFGVAHKERLKKLRAHVDVLTMSATPIPRTLHFSLIGLRDMSIINTAPNDRLPIHTCVAAWDADLIREAVTRELARQGQVFYLHNRVQTIDQTAVLLRRIVPHARIGVGHGRMHKHELEDVMTAFINKELDVLVCTTIIGSGIDIPNANTIIIDRADTFGLSELYQIRGRVGRYKHRAFAYLLVPGDRALGEEAQQRLKALEDFSALGSGFRIAMRDLEIRGAGDLLGAEQSGHIATVGYETYRQLIAEAVAELKGEPLRTRSLPPFDIAVDAHIPEEYVAAPQQKMTLYRRIAGVQSAAEVDEMLEELRDRFGNPPAPVRRLLDVMRARALAADAGVKAVAAGREGVSVEFQSAQCLSHAAQARLREHFGSALHFAWREKPAIRLAAEPDRESPLETTLKLLMVLQDV